MFARVNRFSFKNGVPGKILQSPFFVVRFDNNTSDNFECAVIVGKKVDKRAVVRNRIKRQVVAILQELVPTTSLVRMILYAKKGIISASPEEIREEIKKALEKVFSSRPQ